MFSTLIIYPHPANTPQYTKSTAANSNATDPWMLEK